MSANKKSFIKWSTLNIFLFCSFIAIICTAKLAEAKKYEFLENNLDSKQYIDENGLIYNIDDSAGMCTVTSYMKDNITDNIDMTNTEYVTLNKNIIIPDTYMGYKVVAIEDYAFKDSNIESIVIGNNITDIGIGAFEYCDKLNSVIVNGQIKKIHNACFAMCKSLEAIELSQSVKKIGDSSFVGCSSLYQVIIPKSVEKINKNAFNDCKKRRLTLVTPNNSYAHLYAEKYGYMAVNTKDTKLSVEKIQDLSDYKGNIFLYNSPQKAVWKSSKPSVVEVNKYGKITAKKAGKAVITAESGDKTYKCNVNILKRNKKNCLKVIYSNYVTKEMSDYEKIYAAHAWLIRNVKYDKRLYKTGTVPIVSHTAEGAFNKGVAVCDGYAKAFIIIMKHYKIQSRMITGGYHAWNLVKIKNKWYHIDCTYDDPIVNGSFNNKYVYMDFFLKTDEYMYKTHVWDYDAYPRCNSKKIDKKYRTVR